MLPVSSSVWVSRYSSSPLSSSSMLFTRSCVSLLCISEIAPTAPRIATSRASLCAVSWDEIIASKLPVACLDRSTACDSSAGSMPVVTPAVPAILAARDVSLIVVLPSASLSMLLIGPAYLSTASVSSLLSTRVPAGRLTSSPRPLAPSILMEPSGNIAISRPSSPVSVRPSAYPPSAFFGSVVVDFLAPSGVKYQYFTTSPFALNSG